MFIFDDTALVGSSNLTDGGLLQNREAVVQLNQTGDAETVESAKALFFELWEAAKVLTPATLNTFSAAWRRAKEHDPHKDIEDAIGRVEPKNVNANSGKRSKEQIFSESLTRRIREQYEPAFAEVAGILRSRGFHRAELAGIGDLNEANRFLNFVRTTYVIGDEAYETAPLVATPAGRASGIERFGAEWATTNKPNIPENYTAWLTTVQRVFARQALQLAGKQELTEGLLCLHAFRERERFVKDKKLAEDFWGANTVERARATFLHLLYGPGDFVVRLHDVLYDAAWKLSGFNIFCALELMGTVRPKECPPINGRMAKALRFLGFDVKV